MSGLGYDQAFSDGFAVGVEIVFLWINLVALLVALFLFKRKRSQGTVGNLYLAVWITSASFAMIFLHAFRYVWPPSALWTLDAEFRRGIAAGVSANLAPFFGFLLLKDLFRLKKRPSPARGVLVILDVALLVLTIVLALHFSSMLDHSRWATTGSLPW
jgi:hypothetical protein